MLSSRAPRAEVISAEPTAACFCRAVKAAFGAEPISGSSVGAAIARMVASCASWAPSADAPALIVASKPISSTAATTLSATSCEEIRTEADSASRFTDASSTPGTARMARSTEDTQDAQDIPRTSSWRTLELASERRVGIFVTVAWSPLDTMACRIASTAELRSASERRTTVADSESRFTLTSMSSGRSKPRTACSTLLTQEPHFIPRTSNSTSRPPDATVAAEAEAAGAEAAWEPGTGVAFSPVHSDTSKSNASIVKAIFAAAARLSETFAELTSTKALGTSTTTSVTVGHDKACSASRIFRAQELHLIPVTRKAKVSPGPASCDSSGEAI
mmetsp:Transcript_55302/g.129764  ORF Transcript_55302/g.129764 Transcript_55302/m.129764 type:complete len:332 (+) Transcript_55302:1383-2378(+)